MARELFFLTVYSVSSKVTYHLGEELHCPHATRLQYLRDSGRLSEVLKWDTLPSKARSVWTRGWHWNVHSFQHCQIKEMTNEIYLNGGVKSSMALLMFHPTVRARLLNEPCLFFFLSFTFLCRRGRWGSLGGRSERSALPSRCLSMGALTAQLELEQGFGKMYANMSWEIKKMEEPHHHRKWHVRTSRNPDRLKSSIADTLVVMSLWGLLYVRQLRVPTTTTRTNPHSLWSNVN